MDSVEKLRDRFVARELAALSPEQRLARFEKLQGEAMARLRQSPAGWEAFMRRNIRKRAVRVSGTHG